MKEMTLLSEFSDVTKNPETYSVFKLGTSCCGPCGVVRDMLCSIEKGMGDVAFYEIDCEECDPDLVDALNPDMIPTTFVYKGNECVEKVEGIRPEQMFRDILNAALNK